MGEDAGEQRKKGFLPILLPLRNVNRDAVDIKFVEEYCRIWKREKREGIPDVEKIEDCGEAIFTGPPFATVVV